MYKLSLKCHFFQLEAGAAGGSRGQDRGTHALWPDWGNKSLYNKYKDWNYDDLYLIQSQVSNLNFHIALKIWNYNYDNMQYD